MPRLAHRVATRATTVFAEFSALAAEHRAVNLGQGFPDFDGPEEIKEAAQRAIRDGLNQYAISSGALALREAIAAHAARFYRMQVDPGSMVAVTSGATEAIFDAALAFLDPGDEAILFEPFYDSYVAAVEMAGAVARYVLLRPPDEAHGTWWFEPEELRQAFTPRTRLLFLNTPHNPTGKVFDRTELEAIAALCDRHDVVVVADEVYEHLVYSPAEHVRFATLPGMGARTLTLSSSGKTFSLTGWKIGWAIAEPPLLVGLQRAHQFVTFATASPLQAAIAEALRLPDSYFATLRTGYRSRRDLLLSTLERAGLPTHAAQGAYFLMADIGGLGRGDDFAFCRWLTTEVGVAAIPPSAFYGAEHRAQGQRFARFAFCKTEAVLAQAAERLARARLAAL